MWKSLEVFVAICPGLIPPVLILIAWKLWETYTLESRDKSSNLKLPPGSMGLPFIGETAHFAIWGADFYRRRRAQYGNVFKTHILGRPTIRVMGADNVKKILTGDGTLVTSQWPKSTRIILGEGIALSSGDLHKRRRHAVIRAFDPACMESYVARTAAHVRRSVSDWCARDAGVLLQDEIKRLMFNISAEQLLGLPVLTRDAAELTRLYSDISKNLFSLPVKIPGLGLHSALKSREKIFAKLDLLIDEQLKAWATSPGKHCDDNATAFERVVHHWINGGCHDVSRSELKFAVLEMLLLGHEKTASACSMMALYLHNTPDVIEKIHAELIQHELNDPSVTLTQEKLNKLTYLNTVIKELLRISPAVGGGFRKALETFEVDGYMIPKDWTVIYSIRDTHEIQESTPRADVFAPERWDDVIGYEESGYDTDDTVVAMGSSSSNISDIGVGGSSSSSDAPRKISTTSRSSDALRKVSTTSRSSEIDRIRHSSEIDIIRRGSCCSATSGFSSSGSSIRSISGLSIGTVSGASVTKTTDYSYIPFGAGSRCCAGKEFAKLVMRVFVVEMVRLSTYRLHNPNPELRQILTPAAKDGLPATFTSRFVSTET
ncbi:PREDICTED: cytochrome P450 26A1-like [Priapulus caudatus]|uniref:Cytochrome P450 26A1-like n=1 Tax=Priapulus caudatus TaxID=37621 RepID=A0ABM1DP21_PRICU|nr:PREDICTED: cytochrome P450 26A1-like [Priapulus caudatus]